MKKAASNKLPMLCGIRTMLTRAVGIVMVLVLAAGIHTIPAFAASNGIYIATATPHYAHPTTGAIEDAGGDGSAVLGQSMTESATYGQALVEVDPSGNTYITVRLQLMDNIQNPQFQVDAARNGAFSPVGASLMQEDYTNNTADYRMQVANENVIIRCNMYVIAMGRDVVFYITVSGLTPGSGDFVTSVEVTQPAAPETPAPSETAAQASSQAASSSQTAAANATEADPSAANVNAAPSETESQPAESAEAAEETEPESTEETEEETKKETKKAGLQEFDASGNEVEESTEAGVTTEAAKGKISTVFAWVAGVVVVLLAAGAAIWYFGVYKKKR